MSSSDVAAYLLISLSLAVLVGLWARAWGRSGLAWGLATLLLTPFALWFVALLLVIRGRRR